MRKVTRKTPGLVLHARAEPEDIHPREHFEEDTGTARKIEQRAQDNAWAWCIACVTVSWEGFSGEANLGCCSFESAEEFQEDEAYDSLVDQALEELNKEVDEAREAISKLDAAGDGT